MAIAKQQALKFINPIIGMLFIIQSSSGMLHQVIPYEVFEKVHGSTGFLLSAFVITHVILNWSWFRTAFKKRIPH